MHAPPLSPRVTSGGDLPNGSATNLFPPERGRLQRLSSQSVPHTMAALLPSVAAVCWGAAAFSASPTVHRVPRVLRVPAAPRCALEEGDLTAKLQQELARRSEGGVQLEFAPGMGRMAALQQQGPHHTTTPKEVVEYVIMSLRQKNVTEAFKFTCIPSHKRGCHKSSTDWTRRMAWEKARVIGGAPSGKALESDDFEAMVRSTYGCMLETKEYRFIGDSSAWQQKRGHEKMTAVKEYVVETKTAKGDHLLLKFKLVYDWCAAKPRAAPSEASTAFLFCDLSPLSLSAVCLLWRQAALLPSHRDGPALRAEQQRLPRRRGRQSRHLRSPISASEILRVHSSSRAPLRSEETAPRLTREGRVEFAIAAARRARPCLAALPRTPDMP